MDCERTNYLLKDKPNHYGVCLLFYFSLNENKCAWKFNGSNSRFIPVLTSKIALNNLHINSATTILRLERINKHKFVAYSYEVASQIISSSLSEVDIQIETINQEILHELVELIFEFAQSKATVVVEQSINNLKSIFSKLGENGVKLLLFKSPAASEFLASINFLINLKYLDQVSISKETATSLFEHVVQTGIAKKNDSLLLLIKICGLSNSKSIIDKLIQDSIPKYDTTKEGLHDYHKHSAIIKENLNKILI